MFSLVFCLVNLGFPSNDKLCRTISIKSELESERTDFTSRATENFRERNKSNRNVCRFMARWVENETEIRTSRHYSICSFEVMKSIFRRCTVRNHRVADWFYSMKIFRQHRWQMWHHAPQFILFELAPRRTIRIRRRQHWERPDRLRTIEKVDRRFREKTRRNTSEFYFLFQVKFRRIFQLHRIYASIRFLFVCCVEIDRQWTVLCIFMVLGSSIVVCYR